MSFSLNGAINQIEDTFSRSTDVTSTDPVSAKGKTKEVYCCDIVVLIVLFWCFWCMKDYNVVSVYWNIVWWGYETISISWLLFSPLLGQLCQLTEKMCGLARQLFQIKFMARQDRGTQLNYLYNKETDKWAHNNFIIRQLFIAFILSLLYSCVF